RRVPGMDGALAAIIDRCLEVDPQRRFHDAGAVLEALDRRDRARRRRPVLVVGLVAPVLLVLLMTGLAYRNGRREIDAAGEHLAERITESGRVNARLVASVVQEHLQDRIEFLQDFCEYHSDELLQLPRGKAVRPLLRDLLENLYKQGRQRKYFQQYTLADA